MRKIRGLNIQWPWSEELILGRKTIETRSYPLSEEYMDMEIAVIETPGKKGKKEAGITKARIIGIIKFSGCKQYKSLSEWKKDKSKHLVSLSDPDYAFHSDKPRWGWIVSSITRFPEPLPAPTKKGIVWALGCKVP